MFCDLPSGDIKLKFLNLQRGKAAIETINIIPRYGGVIIHDRWASYLSWHGCSHALCGSHLLRELTFIVDAHASFTNNRAERDLRIAKVKQKISGCFRSSENANAYCRISSYLQSMANRRYNSLAAIQISLAGRTHETWDE